MRRVIFIVFATIFAATACNDTDVEEAAVGVAQLTVSQVSVLSAVVLSDTNCGFQSADVLDAGVVTGEPGTDGQVRYVTTCTLDFDQSPVTLETCGASAPALSGRVTVTATLTIAGTVTGDPVSPILTRTPDALTLSVSEAKAELFTIDLPDDGPSLTVREGSLAFTARPRLAASESTGLCTIATPEVTLEDIRYTFANLFVDSGDGSAHIFVQSSNIDAQVGQGPMSENSYGGTINFGLSEVELPVEGMEALDTSYDRAEFLNTFSCTDDLAQPLNYDCSGGSAEDQLATGIARLTMQSLSAIASQIATNDRCGFSSPNALARATVVGRPGQMGSITVRAEDCAISADIGTVAFTDCSGNETLIEGRATVTAAQTVRGILTGNTDNPIAPVVDDPLSIHLESIRFDELVVSLKSSTAASALPALKLLSGTLTATVVPRFAVDQNLGLCSVQTPVARFSHVQYQNARVALVTDAGKVAVPIGTSDLSAVSGSFDGQTNSLFGTMTMAGLDYELPIEGDEGLLPDFDQANFDASWTCADELQDRPPEFECDPTATLVDASSRLTPLLAATLVGLLEDNSLCGFAGAGAQVSTTGKVGQEGSLTLSLARPCMLRFDRPTIASVDCLGNEVLVEGDVRVNTATRRVQGFLTGDPRQPVVPTSRESTRYTLDAEFTGFSVRTGTTALTVASGSLSGAVSPRAALDTRSGACVLATPVAQIDALTYDDAEVKVTQGDTTLGLAVSSSDLDATTGRANALSGEMTVDGRTYTVPTDASVPGLVPDFDASAFDATFACTPNLVVPTDDVQCSLRGVLAPAVAALAVQNVVNIAVTAALDMRCGFMSPLVFPLPAVPPVPPMGPPVPGTAGGLVSGCTIALPPNTPIGEDCLRGRTVASGGFTVTASQATSGLRIQQCMGPVCIQGTIPVTRDALQLSVTALSFSNYASAYLPPGMDVVSNQLALVGGNATYEFVPILGESAMNAGVFDVFTPVGRLSQLRLQNVNAQASLQGRRFDLTIDDSSIDASIGMYQGQGNRIAGWISIDGQRIPLDGPLDPEFDQALFDLGYDCTPNLAATIPPN